MKLFKSILFDCDGVILNSNKIKTQAFFDAVIVYGLTSADALVKYHIDNGGVSRYQKIEYFFNTILGRQPDDHEVDIVLSKYALIVRSELAKCEIVSELFELRKLYSDAKWFVVSGGDQMELREIFKERGLFNVFDGGIYGSPDSKDLIFERELQSGNVILPAVFVGDSKYDYESSNRAGIDFIFASYWTDFKDYRDYFSGKSVLIIKNMADLL
jgi:phosphoglycolate phosphatase-like HAD superfamily hydrolase